MDAYRVYKGETLLLLANAAPEWQARNPRRRSRELKVACPLGGLVRSVGTPLKQTGRLHPVRMFVKDMRIVHSRQ
jgi:hypothetical protein